jgi:response regulator RpfG family c-di-GMP phosphodiesterase
MVDDDEDDRIIIDEAFMQIGYGAEIKKFISSDALFKYLDQLEPNLYPSLIVIDRHVRHWEPTDVLKKLKQHPAYGKIPVVIYSSTLSSSEKAEFEKLGVKACIEKGALMSEVTDIARHLKEMAEAGDRSAAKSKPS